MSISNLQNQINNQIKNLNQSQQQLPNHSFQGQDLTKADFRGANLRGCNFQYTTLQDADFRGAQLGRSRRQWLQLGFTIAIAALITGNATYSLIFSALGQPLAGTRGILVVVLHGVLMLTGLATLWSRSRPRLAYGVGSSLSAAIVGFCYGGILFDRQLIPAVVGAILLLIVGDFISWFWRDGLGAIAFFSAIVVVSSGAVFLLGTTAIAGLDTGHWLGGIFSGLTVLSLGFTWRWSGCLEHQISQFGGTRFDGADLTGALFDEVER